MDNMSFDLLFIPSTMGHHPVATVFVKFFTGKDYGGLGTGKSFLSNECASFSEFSAEIDRLQRELESLKLPAKAKFAKGRETQF